MRATQLLWRLKNTEYPTWDIQDKVHFIYKWINIHQSDYQTNDRIYQQVATVLNEIEQEVFDELLLKLHPILVIEEMLKDSRQNYHSWLQKCAKNKQSMEGLTPIEKANLKPSFSHLIALRSGVDKFSSMQLPQLIELIGYTPLHLQHLHEDKDKAVYCRWVLRGLTEEAAWLKIRQVHRVQINAALSKDANKGG